MIKFVSLAVTLCLGVTFISCTPLQQNTQRPDVKNDAERFHLGSHTFPISTSSPEAQRVFNRGMILAYAFSHKAAELEFRRAAELDPSAAMPWWGVALVNGPHINFPIVPEEKANVAWEALRKAKERIAGARELEVDLVTALGYRYARRQPKDRSKLDIAYAEAMKRVASKHPNNSDVTTLYAEALMDLHPWDLWTIGGEPKPWTAEVVKTLELALQQNAEHPGANHLYIHTVEASNNPGRGVPSADKLRALVPGAGHLVHMPAHIYIRVGRWEDSAHANTAAIEADAHYRKSEPQPGFYAVYMLHNHHFLTFTRMMQGQREEALKSARSMLTAIPDDFLRDFGPIADGYLAIVSEVLMRFGRWEEILNEPEPKSSMPVARAFWRFTRVSALTALGRKKDADRELTEFKKAVRKVPADAVFGNNPAHALLKIAHHVLLGEMKAAAGHYGEAVKELHHAVRLEDELRYDEPPDWIIPVRHTLGATLMSAGKYLEAERVYREDLKKFPANGWSLFGLSKALRGQHRLKEADNVIREFDREWANADTKIGASCMCQKGDNSD